MSVKSFYVNFTFVINHKSTKSTLTQKKVAVMNEKEEKFVKLYF